MADFRALLDAVAHCCEGGGAHRAVVDVPRVGAYPAAAAQEAARAVQGPLYEVWIRKTESPSSGSWHEAAAVKQVLVSLTIRLEAHTAHELEHDARTELRDRMWSMAERIRRAVQCPGNLAVSPSGVSTYLASGCLGEWTGTQIEREDWPRRRFSLTSDYRGLVILPAPMEAS